MADDVGEDGEQVTDVKGEDTDGLVTGFAAPMLFLIALGGIASGGMFRRLFLRASHSLPLPFVYVSRSFFLLLFLHYLSR